MDSGLALSLTECRFAERMLRVFLKKGEKREVKFVITKDDLKYYNSDLQYVYDSGKFSIMVGPNSRDVQMKYFVLE